MVHGSERLTWQATDSTFDSGIVFLMAAHGGARTATSGCHTRVLESRMAQT
jgi:hypothetical protein